MCDANMKSDLLVMDRCKTDARQAPTTRGRRLSKAAVILNGENNSHAPPPITGVCPDFSRESPAISGCESPTQLLPVGIPNELVLPFELDHMYANCATERTKEDGQQLKYMKDLLLLHLDLVKQQQSQLTSRDQKITSLRRENETLRQRVEEANSRISVFEKSEQRRRNNRHSKNGNSYLDFGRQRKSNSLSGDWRCKRTSSADSPHFKHHSTPLSRTDAGGGQSSSKSSSKCRQSSFKSSHSKQSKEGAKDSVLQTDIMYYTPVGEALRGPDTLTNSFDLDEQVLVPTWRIRPVTSCYQMEGTEVSNSENLDDDIFLKRHQKLEIDEKRRKRWDIQRLREQRLQEKLKRGRGGGSKETMGNRSPELSTFYPRVEEVEQVEVSEIIPVSAFGHPIPSIETEEFSVPWLS